MLRVGIQAIHHIDVFNTSILVTTCQEVLESEGVRFENDKADESQRMFADDLRELLDNDDEDED